MIKHHRILFVEDDAVQRKLLCRLSENEGYETLETFSGGECLSILEREDPPDLVVLDLNLPDIYGLDVLLHIRETYNPYQLPVIVLSGMSETEDIIRSMEAGANDYLTKPVDFSTIAARMKVCLSMTEKTRQLIDRERKQVMEETLGAACHHVAQPITALQTELEVYLNEVPQHMWTHRRKIQQLLGWARKSSEVIHRLQNTHTYKTVNYFGDTRILDIPETEESKV